MGPIRSNKKTHIIHRVEPKSPTQRDEYFRKLLAYVVTNLPHAYLNTRHYQHICSDIEDECLRRYPNLDWKDDYDRLIIHSIPLQYLLLDHQLDEPTEL
jgi:hypothetical protein